MYYRVCVAGNASIICKVFAAFHMIIACFLLLKISDWDVTGSDRLDENRLADEVIVKKKGQVLMKPISRRNSKQYFRDAQEVMSSGRSFTNILLFL